MAAIAQRTGGPLEVVRRIQGHALLQFTLRQLYERREEIAAGETRLTHAAYDQLGRLSGAIAAEAYRLFQFNSNNSCFTPFLIRLD